MPSTYHKSEKGKSPAAEPLFDVFCFRQDVNIVHNHEKQCCPHVKLWDAVNFLCCCIYLSYFSSILFDYGRNR